MKLFEKKFKVRVKHFSSEYYCIEYCYYRFIPIWHRLYKWTDPSITAWYDGWNTMIHCSFISAEQFAEKINYEYVKNHNENQLKKEKDFYKRQKEHNIKIIPYDSKIIK